MSGRVNTSRMFARHTLFRLTPRTALSLLQELAAKLGGDRGPYIQRRHRLSYLPNNTILDPPMWVNLFKSCSRPRNLTLCQPQVSVVAGPRNQNSKARRIISGGLFVFGGADVAGTSTRPWPAIGRVSFVSAARPTTCSSHSRYRRPFGRSRLPSARRRRACRQLRREHASQGLRKRDR